LSQFGNPNIKVICNAQPLHPIDLISGRAGYPSKKEIDKSLKEFPLERNYFQKSIESLFTTDKIKQNLAAFDKGMDMINF
jgi:hypothetical protein